jgi:hypothetical protein
MVRADLDLKILALYELYLSYLVKVNIEIVSDFRKSGQAVCY